jgi:DNA-binding NarL/FixJ family response regulator
MIRILLADDQKSIREALRIRLESESDFEIVGTASDGYTAIELAEILRPDIILLDVEMPGIDGVKATQMICQALPEVKVLVLSAHDDDHYVNQAIHAGAMGYLLKNTPSRELREAIRFVYQGYSQLGPGVLNKIVSPESNISNLSPEKHDAQPVTSVVRQEVDNRVVAKTSFEDFALTSSLPIIQDQYGDSDGWGLDLIRILRRRWLPALTALGTMMASVVIYTFLIEEPTYRSEMWIQVSNRSSVPVASLPEDQVDDVEKDVSKGRTTEVQILQITPTVSRRTDD